MEQYYNDSLFHFRPNLNVCQMLRQAVLPAGPATQTSTAPPMFKTAATKIAHNSTIPALGGNQELRPLQDLITAEKAVLISLQKLSVEFEKASDALRTWGLSEGDDLGDILGASATVLNHFSAALSQYAIHGHELREQLKTIRTREEGLDEMKRRRRTVFRKADDADKKLSKMSPEHKNLQMQTDLLNRLRDEIRILDTDVMVEEAALGDFKRTATKMFAGLKFGGLTECCQKGSVAADFGKMIISEISEEKTQPGLHRAFYQGHGKIESLVTEAQRAVSDVTLSTIPTLSFRDRRQYYNGREGPSVPTVPGEKPMPTVPRDGSDHPEFTPPRTFVNDIPPSPKSYSQRQPWSQTQNIGPPQAPLPRERSSVDDFGMNLVRSKTGPMDGSEGTSGRFATFPVKARPAATHTPTYALGSLPLQTGHDLGPSFALSVADALGHKDDSDPSAQVSGAPSSLSPLPSTSITPPMSNNPWADDETKGSSKTRMRNSNLSDNDDALLAYMLSGEEEDVKSFSSQQSLQIPDKNVSPELHAREGRLTELSNPELKSDNRISMEDKRVSGSPSLGSPHVADFTIEREDVGSSKVLAEPLSLETGTSQFETNSASTSQLSPEEEEKALNVAAAREIRHELEALHTTSSKARPSLQFDTVERGRPRAGTGQSYGSSDDGGRDHSPLAPPSAPFARRSISPHPYPEMNYLTSPGSAGHPYGSPHGGPSVPFSQPQEIQYPVRSQGLSPGQVYHPSRLQQGTSPLSGSPFIEPQSLSTSNLSAGVAPGSRTISAAAFRKPRNTSMDNLSRGLPGSPYPIPVGGVPRIFSASAIPPGSSGNVTPSQQLENRLSQTGLDTYDYVDAYLQPNSPHEADFSRDSSLRAEGGYQSGKFSTDLEHR